MKKLLPLLLLSTLALADEPIITVGSDGTITCKGHCTGTISGGKIVVCSGSICLEIIQSPGKNSPN